MVDALLIKSKMALKVTCAFVFAQTLTNKACKLQPVYISKVLWAFEKVEKLLQLVAYT